MCIDIYTLECSCRYPSTMESCSQAVLLHLKVRPGVLHEYVVFAACPGVHLDPILVARERIGVPGEGSCAVHEQPCPI